MREILFRGKRVDNGEWVEGYYIEGTDSNSYIWISENDSVYNCYQIIPETRGEFTGLTDKNGTRIFEGDIVSHDNRNYIICYSFHNCCGFVGEPVSKKPHELVIDDKMVLEVIGNVHDDPEMIGGIENENT